VGVLASVDWVIIGVYFLVLFGVAISAWLRQRAGSGTSKDHGLLWICFS